MPQAGPTQPHIQGGCLCRAVRYTLTAAPAMTRACWCRACQYVSGGNASVSLIVPAAALALTGPLHSHARIAESGTTIRNHFCPTCGTHLLAADDNAPAWRALRAGTLDDPAPAAPTSIIWSRAAPPGPASTPSYPEPRATADLTATPFG